jgi:hypothetical protein
MFSSLPRHDLIEVVASDNLFRSYPDCRKENAVLLSKNRQLHLREDVAERSEPEFFDATDARCSVVRLPTLLKARDDDEPGVASASPVIALPSFTISNRS